MEYSKPMGKEEKGRGIDIAQDSSRLQMAKVMGNQAVVQMMMTRSQAKGGKGYGHSRTWLNVQQILSRGPYGRAQLYSFPYLEPKLKATSCITSGCANFADTWDHKKPISKLFNDNWPYSIYTANRRKQFQDKTNLQPMCRSCNSAKSGGEYDQMYATACMAFEALGEDSRYENVLSDYGFGVKSATEVLSLIDELDPG